MAYHVYVLLSCCVCLALASSGSSGYELMKSSESGGKLELTHSVIPDAGGKGAPYGGANGYKAVASNAATLFRALPPYGATGADGCGKLVQTSVTAKANGCLWATNGGPYDMNTGACVGGHFVTDGKIGGSGRWMGFGVTEGQQWIIGYINASVVSQLNVSYFVPAFGWLVRNGTPATNPTSNFTAPRTAVGVTREGKLLSLEVDGCEDCQWGLTEFQMAELLLAHGAHHAVNLDGGGSSATYFNGTVIDRPTDTDHWDLRKERAVTTIVCVLPEAEKVLV